MTQLKPARRRGRGEVGGARCVCVCVGEGYQGKERKREAEEIHGASKRIHCQEWQLENPKFNLEHPKLRCESFNVLGPLCECWNRSTVSVQANRSLG